MNNITVRGIAATVAANFTRPANTTPYTAGDVVNDSDTAGAVLVFPLPKVGKLGSAIIQSATIVSSVSASIKLDARLWLFDTTLTADNDNAEFTPTDAEMRTLLHVIAFPAGSWVAPGATPPNAACNAQGLLLPINTKVDDNAIYGVLEARNGYTPASGERFDIRLGLLL